MPPKKKKVTKKSAPIRKAMDAPGPDMGRKVRSGLREIRRAQWALVTPTDDLPQTDTPDPIVRPLYIWGEQEAATEETLLHQIATDIERHLADAGLDIATYRYRLLSGSPAASNCDITARVERSLNGTQAVVVRVSSPIAPSR